MYDCSAECFIYIFHSHCTGQLQLKQDFFLAVYFNELKKMNFHQAIKQRLIQNQYKTLYVARWYDIP